VTDQQGVPGRVREGIGTTEGFQAAIAAVDVAGWDSQVGQELLRYLRFEVVAPAVEARRLRGPAREDVIAAGWEAAWRASTTRSVRQADSPWGAIRAAVERAIGGSYVAERCGTSPRTGWRRIGRDGDAPLVVATDATALERAAALRASSPVSCSASERLGQRLEWICVALTAAGWAATVAEDALTWVAFSYSGSIGGVHDVRHKAMAYAATHDGEIVVAAVAATAPDRYFDMRCVHCMAALTLQTQRKNPSVDASNTGAWFRLAAGASHAAGCANDVQGGVRGWRAAAASLGLEPWQLRRLALLVAGGRDHAGLLELVVSEGRDVLGKPAVKRSIATTLRRWAPCPSSLLAAQYPARRGLPRAA
jgi:hypothetical protein